jgi:DNA polymerase III gamma/tau subunit
MPESTATDPITDQEIAFAHLILSGIMTDRRAAKAVGLNPDTASDTIARPCVRAYMIEHRVDVTETLVDQEAQRLRELNIRRDQVRDRVLDRLWELADLSHEATRGSIAGQMKALAMIASIEELIPDKRRSAAKQPETPPIKPDIYKAKWLREQQQQAAEEDSDDPVAATEAQPVASPEPEPEPAPTPSNHTSLSNLDQNQPSLADPVNSIGTNWVPQATGRGFDALLESRQPFSIKKGRFGRR